MSRFCGDQLFMIMRPRVVTYLGQDFDLSHTFPQSFVAKTENRPEGVSIRCILSCHCFTLSPTADSTRDYDYRFEGELRVFCCDRYELSKSISTHLQNALENARTFKAVRSKDKNGQSNNLTVDVLEDGLRYSMFFDLSQSPAGDAADLLLHVRSAYMRNFRRRGAELVRVGTLIDQKLGLRKSKNLSAKHRKK